MTKVDRFEELIMKYLNRFTANYFVQAYEYVYKFLNEENHLKKDEYLLSFGRLWGLNEIMQYEMTEEDAKELQDLILDL